MSEYDNDFSETKNRLLSTAMDLIAMDLVIPPWYPMPTSKFNSVSKLRRKTMIIIYQECSLIHIRNELYK